MGKNDSKALGQAITSARKNAHLTQEELAAKIKVAPRTYQSYESGAVLPRYKTLFKIAYATNTHAPDLLAPFWHYWKNHQK